MKKAILITVRTGSTRLPQKALLEINGKSTIVHLINRLKQSKLANDIILCTTTLKEDNVLEDIAIANGINYYRGSITDKLERWKGACEKYNIESFVTADGDDLFCDPSLIDLAFEQLESTNVDFIKCDNIICGAFTHGIKYNMLKKVCEYKGTDETEMHWVYFENIDGCVIKQLNGVPKKYFREDIRMTLDYEEDFQFFSTIINHFNQNKFGLDEIIYYIEQNPEVAKLNIHLKDIWATNQKNKTKLILK